MVSNDRPFMVVIRTGNQRSVIKYDTIEEARNAIMKSIKQEVCLANDDYDIVKEEVNKLEPGNDYSMLDYDSEVNTVWELY